MKLSTEQIKEFANYLCQEEKSTATQEKYLRDVQAFCVYADGNKISKELIIAWKKNLIERGYAVRSINSMLASVNSLLEFLGLSNCKAKSIRTQRQTYCAEDKELTKTEYLRLLAASKKNEQLNLVIQTICGTGIQVSELRYFTVEAIRYGEVTVDCKNKTRRVSSGQVEEYFAELCQATWYFHRLDFCYPDRQTVEPQQHLVSHEEAVRSRRCETIQSLSP